MRNATAPLLACLLASSPAGAADGAGNYAIWGKGNKSCFNYLRDREQQEDADYKSYVMGYLTAYNTLSPETYSISGAMKLGDIMAWIDDYCDLQQVHGLEQALANFIVKHHDSRLRRPPGGVGR